MGLLCLLTDQPMQWGKRMGKPNTYHDADVSNVKLIRAVGSKNIVGMVDSQTNDETYFARVELSDDGKTIKALKNPDDTDASVGGGVAAVQFRNISGGLTLNTSLFGISVNSSTNVESNDASATIKWKRTRKKIPIYEDVKAGDILVIPLPLFYTKQHGNATSTNRFIYDKMLENPLFIQIGLEVKFVNARTGLNPADVLQGKVGSNTYYQYDPATHTGGPYVDFEFVADRDIKAGSFVGVKVYVEDTTSGPVYRLPRGKDILVSSTYDSYEYQIGGSPGDDATNARNTIFTETSYTPTVSAQVQGAFSAFAILKKTNIRNWGLSGDSIFEAVYDGQTSDGSALSVADPRGDYYANNGWPAVFVGAKLGQPYVNVGRGSDTCTNHAPSYINAAAQNLPAWPTGIVTSGNYLRRQLLEHCGITDLIDGNGTNDLAGSIPYATFMARKKEELYLFKSDINGVRVFCSFILPKGKQIDASVAGIVSALHQTHENYNRALVSGNNASRAQYHRALITGSGSLPNDGYIDTCSVCENDPVNFDAFWASYNSAFKYQFSPDSTHPHRLGADIIGRGATLNSVSQATKTKDGVLANEGMLNFNSTSAQRIYINPRVRAWKALSILVSSATTGTALVNMTGSPVSVGFYSDAACTVAIGDPQAVTGLTTANSVVEIALNTAGIAAILTGDIWMKLSTAHGSAVYANVRVIGRVLD